MELKDTSQELLQCYDETGKPTQGRIRSEVKTRPPKYWYGIGRIWLVNDEGQIMCSKRGEGVASDPGRWQTRFGGHVGYGETIKQTAQRELYEEAGIQRPLDDFFLIDSGKVEKNKVFFESYAVRFNGEPSDLRFSDGEVTEAKWLSMAQYETEKQINPDAWGYPCTPENQKNILVWLSMG